MQTPRIKELAQLVVNHSCSLKPDERVLIESIGAPNSIVLALIRQAKSVGAVPLVNLKDDQVILELSSIYREQDFDLMADCELYTLKKVDAFIGIRGFQNICEYSSLPHSQLNMALEHFVKPVHLKYKIENTKYVFLRWPTPSMAQRAGMSTEAFENLYFDCCIIDYTKMEAAMDPLVYHLKRTDKVRIVGPSDTDITFSIKDMPQHKHAGRHNIPDGEIMTAPVRDSINGRIHYNIPSTFYGTTFSDVCLDFEKGKVVKASCNNMKKIREIFDKDAGARYVGEFAFGVNPYISRPVNDNLFDEKIFGSIHLAQGNSYKECDNGNRSSIHWDLILSQGPKQGDGEIYFDGTLIRKDGNFVLEELEGLNPENLK